MSALTIPSVFTAIDKFSKPVKAMGRNVSKFSSKTEVALARGNRAFRSMVSPIKSLNRALGGFGLLISGALIVGALGSAIGVFKDFEQANANLSSVMANATGPELKLLQEDAIRLGSVTAKSATQVVGLQESFARLGFEGSQIINMTQSTIAGSIAMNSELSDTAELMGAMVKTFDDFSSVDAPTIMDQMVASTQKSALSFEKLQTALPIVSGAANAAGVPFTTLLSLLGKLSDAGIDASSSSTALRNIFLDSASKGHSYEQILDTISNSQDKLTVANDEFGKRGAVSATILANLSAETALLDSQLQNVSGTAEEAANKQLDTLNGSLTLLSSAYEGFILSIEKGNGAFGNTLKIIVQVATEMLNLMSGTVNYVEVLSDHQQKVRTIATKTMFWLKVVGWIVAAILAFKVALIATGVVLGAYNIAMGVMGALTGVSSIAIGSSTLALNAYKVALFITTVATKAWALALNIGIWPLTLIALGIAATIALITVIVKKWNEWGAALTLFMGPLGFVISLVQSFRRNWDMIKDSFKTGGILAGFRAIGVTILDAILMPLQQVFELLAKVPGMSGIANGAISKILSVREGLGVNTGETGVEQTPVINTEVAKQESLQRTISEQKQNVAIDINDKTGRASVDSDNDFVPVNLSSTFGALNFGG